MEAAGASLCFCPFFTFQLSSSKLDPRYNQGFPPKMFPKCNFYVKCHFSTLFAFLLPLSSFCVTIILVFTQGVWGEWAAKKWFCRSWRKCRGISIPCRPTWLGSRPMWPGSRPMWPGSSLTWTVWNKDKLPCSKRSLRCNWMWPGSRPMCLGSSLM